MSGNQVKQKHAPQESDIESTLTDEEEELISDPPSESESNNQLKQSISGFEERKSGSTDLETTESDIDSSPIIPTTTEEETQTDTPVIDTHPLSSEKLERADDDLYETVSTWGRKTPYNRQRVDENGQIKQQPDERFSDHDNNTRRAMERTTESCPDCDGNIVEDKSTHYCAECGIVIVEESVDSGPEWRSFNSSQRDNRERVGSPTNNMFHDKGLSTGVGSGSVDAYGEKISGKKRAQLNRIRKWDQRFKVKNSDERNLRQALGEISRMCSELDLPEHVKETSSTVYRKALDEDLLPGRSIEAITTASIFVAIRQAGIPQTGESLYKVSRVEEDEIRRAFSYLNKELSLQIEPPKANSYMAGIVSELDVSLETEQCARVIMDLCVEKNIHSGKKPSGLAAAAIYAATTFTRIDRITQKEAADAADVCDLTIRNRQSEILKAIGKDPTKYRPPSKSEIEEKNTDISFNGEEEIVELIEEIEPPQ